MLEARDRVGGRTDNATIAGGRAIAEVGGQFVGPTQDRMLALAKAVGVDTFPVYNEGSNVQIAGGQRTLYPAATGIPSDPEMQQALGALLSLDALAKQVGVAAPWKHKKARAYDGQTLGAVAGAQGHHAEGDGARRRRRARRSGAPTPTSCRCCTCCSTPRRPATRCRRVDARLLSTPGGAQERRLVGGSVVVAQKVAAQLGSRVVLGAPVRRIAQTATAASRVTARRRSPCTPRQAIVAVPPVLAARIAYAPGLPAAKKTLLKAMTPGSLTKVEAVYDRRRSGASGPQRPGLHRHGAARVPFDNSPPDGGVGVLFSFVGGRQHARLGRRSTPPRGARGSSTTSCASPATTAPARPTSSSRRTGRPRRGRAAARSATSRRACWPSTARGCAAPSAGVHFAGTETADYWLGYMDGAVRAGERAAGEALAALKASS